MMVPTVSYCWLLHPHPQEVQVGVLPRVLWSHCSSLCLSTPETCVYPPRLESLFPPVQWAPALKPNWPSKSTAHGALPPDARHPGWGAWHGAQNSHSCGTGSVNIIILQFVGHAPGVYGIWLQHKSITPSVLWPLFAFGCRINFFGRFHYFVINSCSSVSCAFGVFVRGGKFKSFYSTILSQTFLSHFKFAFCFDFIQKV